MFESQMQLMPQLSGGAVPDIQTAIAKLRGQLQGMPSTGVQGVPGGGDGGGLGGGVPPWMQAQGINSVSDPRAMAFLNANPDSPLAQRVRANLGATVSSGELNGARGDGTLVGPAARGIGPTTDVTLGGGMPGVSVSPKAGPAVAPSGPAVAAAPSAEAAVQPAPMLRRVVGPGLQAPGPGAGAGLRRPKKPDYASLVAGVVGAPGGGAPAPPAARPFTRFRGASNSSALGV